MEIFGLEIEYNDHMHFFFTKFGGSTVNDTVAMVIIIMVMKRRDI